MGKIKNLLKKYMTKHSSIHELAVAGAWGAYIAFSPFVGFHTLMTIVFSWAFSLNFFVMFGVSTLINNPWTMAFVYAFDYMVGYYIIQWLHIDPHAFNPGWLQWLNNHIQNYCSVNGISLSAFLIGGNVIAVLAAVLTYPILYGFFKAWHRELTE